MNSNRYFEILLIICLCLFCEKGYPNQNGNIDFAKLKYKALYALRTDHPPQIDGILDEEIWKKADVTSDFLQFFPYGLVAPSLQTDVYVMYDDNYLYIGIYNHDPEPDKIVGLLARQVGLTVWQKRGQIPAPFFISSLTHSNLHPHSGQIV